MIKKNNGDGMSTYTVQTNQSVFDVAMAIHGTIDGLADILVNNKGLNLVDDIEAGEEIVFTSIITLNKPVVDFLDSKGIVVANNGLDVKFQQPLHPIIASLSINKSSSIFEFTKTDGDIYIDWGDESDIELFTSSTKHVYHQFDISVAEKDERFNIRIFGDKSTSLGDVEVISTTVESCILYRSVSMTGYIDGSEIENPEFISLADGIKHISLANATSGDFGFLGRIETIRELYLETKNTTPESIDSLFKTIVNEYGGRLPASIKTKIAPNGKYQAPKDNLPPKTGMEAVWVLINSEQWNTETHRWKIEIDGIEYEKVAIEEEEDEKDK